MKKKITAVCLVICLLAICVGGTLAYLTDTKAQLNTFTVGNVQIKLDECGVVKNVSTGNLDDNGTRVSADDAIANQTYHLYPAMTVAKDPTITVTGSESAYIAAKVTLSTATLRPLIKGGILGDTQNTAIVTDPAQVAGKLAEKAYVVYENGNTLYFFCAAPIAPNASVTLFEELVIPADWNNTQLAALAASSINVQAYATQTNGFANAYVAMTTAFDNFIA